MQIISKKTLHFKKTDAYMAPDHPDWHKNNFIARASQEAQSAPDWITVDPLFALVYKADGSGDVQVVQTNVQVSGIAPAPEVKANQTTQVTEFPVAPNPLGIAEAPTQPLVDASAEDAQTGVDDGTTDVKSLAGKLGQKIGDTRALLKAEYGVDAPNGATILDQATFDKVVAEKSAPVQ